MLVSLQIFVYGTWPFKLFLPFVEGGKKKAKKAHINVAWYILMYAWSILMNLAVHQINREQSFS